MAANTLLTFVGYHDPYYKGPLEGEELKGPILYLLGLRPFDRIVLFSTPNLTDRTEQTAGAIEEHHSGTAVEICHCDIDDPTDYSQIFASLRKHFRTVVSGIAEGPGPEPACYIATASGTPQMHAVWFMLAASGEVPAKILQARPPQFVTAQKQAVDEIDPLAPGFPRVRLAEGGFERSLEGGYETEGLRAPNVKQVVEDLGIVGRHPSMEQTLERAASFAAYSSPVLIQGETGTGKELIASLIHRLSGRPKERFVTVNCSALPPTLSESALFGHRKGAFTGADRDQEGKFVMADGGTLFLDEIGELPQEVQAKLLRVLEDGIVEPIGAGGSRKVDVRVIAATNRDLGKDVGEGRFRKDLYYRLEVGTIDLPPLRERKSDIPFLALSGMDNINKNLKRPKTLSQEAIQELMRYSWPGNVRQLLRLLERSAMLTRKDVIGKEDLSFTDRTPEDDFLSALPEPQEGFVLEQFLAQARCRLIRMALDSSGGNQSAAARKLSLTPQAIHNFLMRDKNKCQER